MEGKEIHSDEARRNLRELLDSVGHRDEHITIRRYNRPVAVIVPMNWYEAARKILGEEQP